MKLLSAVTLNYETKVQTPNTRELLPTTDFGNTTNLFYGNINLIPEYHHSLMLFYNNFDQFNMRSTSFSVRGEYTKNKIAYAKTINPNSQQINIYMIILLIKLVQMLLYISIHLLKR